MSSNNERLRRNPPRSSSSSNSINEASTASASASSSSSRPVRQTRQTTNGGVRKVIVVDDDDDDDLEVIKPAPVKSSSGLSRPAKASTSASAASGSSDVNFDDVAKLESITGLSRTESIELLKACNNNLETAINIHLSSDAATTSKPSATKPKAAMSSSAKGPLKRTHDDVYQSDESSSSAAATSADDEVRAPIPQKSEKLIDYDPYAALRIQQIKRPKSAFDGNAHEDFKESETSPRKRKAQSNLAQLYKPPIDLMFKGSFEAAKAYGCKENKWILLNVQKTDSFECHCLNRDLWKDETVKDILKASFVFMLNYEDTPEGAKMINYYRIADYPFIAVLNPRTGEKVHQFKKKYDKYLFCEAVTTFLSDHELPMVQDDILEDNTDEATSTATNTAADSDKKTNGLNGHGEPAVNGKVDLSKNGYFNSITRNKDPCLTNGSPLPKGKTAASVLAELTGEPSYAEPEVDVEKDDESSNDSDQKIYRTGKSKAKLESSDEEDEEVVVRKDKYDLMKRSASQKLVDDVKQISIASKPPQTLKHETEGPGVKDCFLRILFPNGDRLDFATNRDSNLKMLVDYLATLGFKRSKHELIERLMPQYQSKEPVQQDSQVTHQSRNLLSLDPNKTTFKDANLFPRTFLLLQEI